MQFIEAKKILKGHQTDLSDLGVYSLAIFGSIAKDQSKKKSDVDILIDFDATRGLFGFIDVRDYLESILHQKVDLVTKEALHPALKENILREARHIF
jgi:predicted nucleotidyltransferase